MQGSRPKDTVEDFAAKLFSHSVLKDNGCLEWVSSLRGGGYGHFCYNFRDYVAHRASWQLIFGSIPKGLFICHHCDNRKCIRPDHLFLGTQRDNIRDASKKRRLRFGKDNYNTKLSPRDVCEVRELWRQRRFSQRELAKKFGVNHKAIFQVIHNLSHKESL